MCRHISISYMNFYWRPKRATYFERILIQLKQLAVLTSRLFFVLLKFIVFVLIVRAPLRHYSLPYLRTVSELLFKYSWGKNKTIFLKLMISHFSLLSKRTLYPYRACIQCATFGVTAPLAYQRRVSNSKNQWQDKSEVIG